MRQLEQSVRRRGVLSLDRDTAVLAAGATGRIACRSNGLRLGQRDPNAVAVVGRTVNQVTVLGTWNVLDEPKMTRARYLEDQRKQGNRDSRTAKDNRFPRVGRSARHGWPRIMPEAVWTARGATEALAAGDGECEWEVGLQQSLGGAEKLRGDTLPAGFHGASGKPLEGWLSKRVACPH